jgi:hypothetical protein
LAETDASKTAYVDLQSCDGYPNQFLYQAGVYGYVFNSKTRQVNIFRRREGGRGRGRRGMRREEDILSFSLALWPKSANTNLPLREGRWREGRWREGEGAGGRRGKREEVLIFFF